MNNDFNILPKTVIEIQQQRKREIKGRRQYIYQIAGSYKYQRGGTITIDFNTVVLTFKTKNVARRLDEIFNDLMRGKSKYKNIQQILEGRRNFTLEEIKNLPINIAFDQE